MTFGNFPGKVKNILQVIFHYLATFTELGHPLQVKTNKVPAYTSSSLQQFYKQYHIDHQTGIPYNPSGQVTVE